MTAGVAPETIGIRVAQGLVTLAGAGTARVQVRGPAVFVRIEELRSCRRAGEVVAPSGKANHRGLHNHRGLRRVGFSLLLLCAQVRYGGRTLSGKHTCTCVFFCGFIFIFV